MKRLLCLFLAVFLLLSGCGNDRGNPGGTTAGAEDKPPQAGGIQVADAAPMGYEAQVYSFSQTGLTFLCRAGDGFLLCTDGGNLPLDGSFAETGPVDATLPGSAAAAHTAEGLWQVGRSGDLGFSLYRDDVQLHKVAVYGGDNLQLLPRQEGAYLCDGKRLFRGEAEIALPEPSADGTRYTASALLTVEGQLYAVIAKSRADQEESTDLGAWLCQIGPDTASLEPKTGLPLPEGFDYVLPLCEPGDKYLYNSGDQTHRRMY